MRNSFFALFGLLLGACSGGHPAGPNMDAILADEPAAVLSDYALFEDKAATRPTTGVVSYELINPLFSDHSVKERLVFVPHAKQASWSDEEVFDFPVGSVLVKSFSYPETGRIETRLLINKTSGWVAYPYVWNEEKSEAVYAPIGTKKPIKVSDLTGNVLEFTYAVPNQNQCKTCHQAGDCLLYTSPSPRDS